MCGRIDAARETADHGQSGISQLIGELIRGLAAVVSRAARADNADRMMIALLNFTPPVKHDWRRVDLAQRLGIGWRILRDHSRTEVFDPFQFGWKIDNRFPIRNL